MIFIHTADWHLGQTFFGYERNYEHSEFLNWLVKTIGERGADVLLISGDIFDTPNPSAAAQRTFYNFIHDVTQKNPNLRIIVTAGNHDSGARLEAPDTLLGYLGATVRGTIKRNNDGTLDYQRHIIPLSEDTCCIALPYLRQGDYPTAESYSEGVKDTFLAVAEEAKRVYKNIVIMGHLFAVGGEVSTDDRSERTVVGGLDCVDLSAVADVATYVALGHLHKAQCVGEYRNIRYSGAPLPMSFAEIDNRQSVTMITLNGKESKTEEIEIPHTVTLIRIPKEGAAPIATVLDEISQLPEGNATETSPFLEIRIAITEPEPTLRQTIEQAVEGKTVRLTRMEALSEQGTSKIDAPLTYDEVRNLDPQMLANDFFRRNFNNNDMPESLQILLKEVITEIRNEDFSN